MNYSLGIDLGTTFTAAAICEAGQKPAMISLGSSGYAVPSVLFLRQDGTFLIGEAAETRAATDPTRVARYFKRQLGDPGSRFIGGTPFSPQSLTSHLLKEVLQTVSKRQGSDPETIVLTHPANWGPYRREIFEQAATIAGVSSKLVLLSEPEAAAIHYASSEKIESGELLGVYDLGGGTFDAVIMRRTDHGFETVGQPQGVERLGGVDFDESIWAFVIENAEIKSDDLADDDEATMAAGYALRNSCVAAKRLLSADTSADIRVALPNLNRTIRLNRDEFERRIRPRLAETIDALEAAMQSGGVTAQDINRILLVGGSSRIPLVGQLLIQHFGRPLGVDSDPKNTVALGAALHGTLTRRVEPPIPATPPNISPTPAAPIPPTATPPIPVSPTAVSPTAAPPTPVSPPAVQAIPVSPTPVPPPAEPSTPDLPTPDLPTPDLPTANLPTADLPTTDMPTTDSAARVARADSLRAAPIPPEPNQAQDTQPEQPSLTAEPPGELDLVSAESRHRAALPTFAKKENPFAENAAEQSTGIEPVSGTPATLLIVLAIVLLLVIIAVVVLLRS